MTGKLNKAIKFIHKNSGILNLTKTAEGLAKFIVYESWNMFTENDVHEKNIVCTENFIFIFYHYKPNSLIPQISYLLSKQNYILKQYNESIDFKHDWWNVYQYDIQRGERRLLGTKEKIRHA